MMLRANSSAINPVSRSTRFQKAVEIAPAAPSDQVLFAGPATRTRNRDQKAGKENRPVAALVVEDKAKETVRISTRGGKRSAAADAAAAVAVAADAADTTAKPAPPAKMARLMKHLETTLANSTVPSAEGPNRPKRALPPKESKEEKKVKEEKKSKEVQKKEVAMKKDGSDERPEWISRPEQPEVAWDKTAKTLGPIRERISREIPFGDYYESNFKRAEHLIKKIAKKDKLVLDAKVSKKIFWFEEFGEEARSDLSHLSIDCAKILTKKGGPSTIAEVETLLRLIAVGSICERCRNPFGLSDAQLNQIADECKCPKPVAPLFNIVRQKNETPAQKRKRFAEWDKFTNDQEKKAIDGLKTKLIEELPGGEKEFLDKYPNWDKPLSTRADEFGIAVRVKQLALHILRREHNQPPTFIFAWTAKSKGTAYLPSEWLLDGKLVLSDGAKKDVKGKGLRELKCKCKDHCGTGACCSQAYGKQIKWTVNRNSILCTKDGLFPCGTAEDCIRQPHEVEDVKMSVCSSKCSCAISCPSRFADRGNQKITIIFQTEERGWSLRTMESRVRGEYVLSFSGVVCTPREVKVKKESEEMTMNITETLVISSDAQSNEFRCINHSCAPNSLAVSTFSREFGNGAPGVAVFTRRKLAAYEEISYDYYKAGFTFKFDCQCGAYCCRSYRYIED